MSPLFYRLCLVLGFLGLSVLGVAQGVEAPSFVEKEFNFSKGDYHLSGRLLLPDTLDRHPVILNIWGSGPTRMEQFIKNSEILPEFTGNGYAVLLYDKPGSGNSRGTLSTDKLLQERAGIARAALEKLTYSPYVDPQRIGLYGSSQAAYVMALLFQNPEILSFAICWSCPMENSIDQTAFQIRQYLLCAGRDQNLAEKAARSYRNSLLAKDYDTYLQHAAFLNQIPEVRVELGWGEILPRAAWTPLSQDSEDLLDPAPFFRNAGIPILAIYGGLDKNINPRQGVGFLEGLDNKALKTAWIPGADHNMKVGGSGCVQEQINGYRDVPGIRHSGDFDEVLVQWLRAFEP